MGVEGLSPKGCLRTWSAGVSAYRSWLHKRVKSKAELMGRRGRLDMRNLGKSVLWGGGGGQGFRSKGLALQTPNPRPETLNPQPEVRCVFV